MLTYVLYNIYTNTIPWGGWTRAYISIVVDDLIDEFMGGLSKRHYMLYYIVRYIYRPTMTGSGPVRPYNIMYMMYTILSTAALEARWKLMTRTYYYYYIPVWLCIIL